MLTTAAELHVVFLLASAVTTAALGRFAWRHQTEQGTRPFVALMAAFTVYSGVHLIGLLTQHAAFRLVLENVQWIGTAVIPVCWVVFAMEYTGSDEMIDWRTVTVLSVVPAITILLTWTNPLHGAMWTQNDPRLVGGLVIVEQTFGPWFWVYTVYTYAAIAFGAFLLLRLIWTSEYLYTGQALLLVVGVTVPVLASVMTVLDVSLIRNPTLDLTPYSFAVTGVAFGYALYHKRLFDLVPATRQLGRNAAIRDLEDGIVIVDADRTIVYCNPSAADMLECTIADVLGQPIQSLVDESRLDFDAEEALAELERDDRVYKIRTSPISDSYGRQIGHTLLVQDVTERKRREHRLARQRDELETLKDLNSVIRSVNRALVSATSRDEIERAVCNRLAESDLYRTVCAADVHTWNGDADRWTTASSNAGDSVPPTTLRGEALDENGNGDNSVPVSADVPDDQSGTWTIAPVVYGKTVYGGLGLLTQRGAITDDEREVLAELGELIGHAIDAVENRQLLSAEAVVELELASTDERSPFVNAGAEADCDLEVTGLVPGVGDDHVAYVRVDGTPAERVCDSLAATVSTSPRTIREREDGGLLEWPVSNETILGKLVEHGANVLQASVEDGTGRFVVELASSSEARSLVDPLKREFPETWIEAKREHDRPIEQAEGVTEQSVKNLTDRQQEALEAAYRAGYFDWPRESTAEEVANTLDISAPTLHAHLRKAESSLLAELFDREKRRASD